MTTLEEYGEKITVKKCRWCEEELDTSKVKGYPHPGGLTVDGYKEKQWLYIHCTNCNYNWSLWKLGVQK